jgi:hypothetical protein
MKRARNESSLQATKSSVFEIFQFMYRFYTTAFVSICWPQEEVRLTLCCYPILVKQMFTLSQFQGEKIWASKRTKQLVK